MKLKKTDLKEISVLLDSIHKIDTTISVLHKIAKQVVNEDMSINTKMELIQKSNKPPKDNEHEYIVFMGNKIAIHAGNSPFNPTEIGPVLNIYFDDIDALEMVGSMIQINESKRNRLMIKLETFGFKK